MAKKKMSKLAKAAELAGPVKDLNGNGKIEDWEVEQALSDLQRVEEHKRKPDLMKKVAKLAGRKAKALKGISSLEELRAVAREKMEEDSED